ncbi:helicase-exonuclease AddAB subunit AddA [Fusibacter tunisiensis]|uniref:ATP-dependent helicase/nuclease subunit A n=1 Tax=Fusibacter tunisiensis TaxID=1008308 RepID=A0ABS2MS54_9FIRM|nr:helicase-exonuclease AddAB subunit AddA [Fusibacter tunisiensis]MBM7562256.1 ATP-dependent helicase/nuclease subunit A [Fusibacter tunisiensis]
MTKWTNEQLAAIEIRNVNLLVSAAAGSGKTAVLVERITRMIVEGLSDVDRMLVVTYTNAAAGEMRSRIESALSSAIEAYPERGSLLNQQIKKLNRAQIKTFHAFCLDVIRTHFLKADLDPNFKLIRDSERLILMEEALDETLEAAYKDQDLGFVELVESYTGNRDDYKLREMIKQLYVFSMSQPYPSEWLSSQHDPYALPDHPLRKKWESILIEQVRALVSGGLSLIDRGIELCQMPGGPEPYIKTLQSDRLVFENLEKSAHEGLEAFESRLSNVSLDRIATLKKDEKDLYDQALVAEVKDVIRTKFLKGQILSKLQSIFNYKTMDQYWKELPELSNRLSYLTKLTQDFSNRFLQMKLDKNLLDFNDLEHYAIEILEDSTVCAFYRDQFNHIFVDEYQDASAIQETIINRICRHGNRFMVGDVKQSIYKFRMADPELFLEKYHLYDVYGDSKDIGDGKNGLRIDLKNNFRTRRDILDQVNGIFSRIMSEKMGDVAYDTHARLNGLMPFEPSGAPYVEMNVISKDQGDGEEGSDVLADLKTDEIEARAIASRIKRLVGKPVYHPKSGEMKPCTYKDIVILLRSTRSWIPAFESVFLEQGIPFYADSQTGYFDTLEIKIMMDLLRIIDNPYQDLALLTVLRSPIVGLSIEELTELKVNHDSDFYYNRLLASLNQESFRDPRLRNFIDQLNTWREEAAYMPLDDFIWRIMQASGFYAYASAMPGGSSRQANLKILVDRASELKNSRLYTLAHFISFIEQMEKSSGDMGVASNIGEEEDVVRLMSIHKSKGLEFPVVIIGGLGKKFNFMDTYGDMIPHKHLGTALAYVNPELRIKSKTLPQMVMKEVVKGETLSEEMRVLYVGLTRPVDRLILFGTVKDYGAKASMWNREIDAYMLSSAGTFLDWVMPTVYQLEAIELNVLYEPDLISQVTTEEVETESRQEKLAEIIESDYAANPDVIQRLNLTLDGIDSQFKPLKVSVTDLKRNQAFQPPDLIDMPEFLKADKPIAGAEKGTLVHKVLEHLDFSKAYTLSSLKEAIAQLDILSEEALKLLDLNKILSFLQSKLGIRIASGLQVKKETPFVMVQDGQLVQGVIDLYFEEADGLVLVDYKTDYVGTQTLEELSQKHVFQIDFYRQALEILTEKPVKEAYIYYLDSNAVYPVKRS